MLFKPKIHVVILKKNTDIEFKKMQSKLNEIEMSWGTVKFKTKHIYGKTRKILFGMLPLWGWKKAFLVIREGDTEPISCGELPNVTQQQVEEWAKSKLIKTLGFDTPRETPLLGILTLFLLIACFIAEILILSGVQIS